MNWGRLFTFPSGLTEWMIFVVRLMEKSQVEEEFLQLPTKETSVSLHGGEAIVFP